MVGEAYFLDYAGFFGNGKTIFRRSSRINKSINKYINNNELLSSVKMKKKYIYRHNAVAIVMRYQDN